MHSEASLSLIVSHDSTLQCHLRCIRDQAIAIHASSSRLSSICMLAERSKGSLSKVSQIRRRLGEKRGTPCWTGWPRWKTAWQSAQPPLPLQQKLPQQVI